MTLACAAAGIACGSRAPSPSPSPRADAALPRLVVVLVIDQLPTWAFERDKHLFTGGLARLLREGAYVRAAELPYANTYTAPGHATIGSGVTPREHGIIGNSWYRRSEGKERSAEYDATAPLLSVGPAGAGEVAHPGASSAAMRVDGVADVLRAAHPDAHSIAIALKPRAAVFVAGRRPQLAVWFDSKAGGMTTSRAYAASVPAWLSQLARDKPVHRFIGQTWTPLDTAQLASLRSFADDHAGEGDIAGLGRAFPHPVTELDALAITPFADQLVLETAEAALAAIPLGADATPDLLALSFNAHDYVGHIYGPDSWEILDLTLRLDLALGELFTSLDARLGPDNWAAVLTSDHGATPLVERTHIPGSRRIPPGEIVDAINAALTPLLGEGAWVTNIAASQVHLSSAIPAHHRDRAISIAATAAASVPNIEHAFRVDAVHDNCATRRDLERAVCLGLAAGTTGDLYVTAIRGSLLHSGDHGTHHESPNPDNREVPIVVRAPALVAPTTIDRASTLQIAPTIAALLGVPPAPTMTAPALF